MAEDVVLEGGEGMFRQTTAPSHNLCLRALLHALQGLFVEVPLHRTLWRVGALRLQRTAPADLRRSHIDHPLLVGLSLFAAQDLLSRTAKGVAVFVIRKLAAVE